MAKKKRKWEKVITLEERKFITNLYDKSLETLKL